MNKLLNKIALQLPKEGEGSFKIIPPDDIPTGGLFGGGRTGEKILQVGVQLLFIAGVILALVFIIWAGINFITSGGDKTKIQSARNKLTYAIIGLIIAFLAFAIITLIGNLFNVPLLGTGGTRQIPPHVGIHENHLARLEKRALKLDVIVQNIS